MKCTKCGSELQENQKFCTVCGTKIETEMWCPQCNGKLEQGQKFCTVCGLKIENIPNQPEQERQALIIPQTESRDHGKSEPDATILHIREKRKTKVGFRIMLLIAFCALFIPFCTVSCGAEIVASPSGYELAGDWGFSEGQMQMMGVTIEDTANKGMIAAILFMVCAYIHAKKHTVRTTICTGVAALFICGVAVGMQQRVEDTILNLDFRPGYWISVLALIGATTAFLWSPILVAVVQKIWKNKKGQTVNLEFLETLDFWLTVLNAFIIVIVICLNFNTVKNIPDIIYGGNKELDPQFESFNEAEITGGIEDFSDDKINSKEDEKLDRENIFSDETLSNKEIRSDSKLKNESSLYEKWIGEYVDEDGQMISVLSADEQGVELMYTGYSEDGWNTDTQLLSYNNPEKTQVLSAIYFEGTLIQETIYTLTGKGITVIVEPDGGWKEGIYIRQ